ncbi:MAG: hypothetical protein CVU73_15530 [Deltaproteobacteria bacterium HGW-Deltaproteobacteria-8]|nr:MAG: hypothetical protein CVU73_15530 [Deltaproteobacteria bacterium HGW-Deltaproteobacteria-8]
MDYIYWTSTVFWLTVPAFLIASFDTLRKFKEKSGKFPTYWTCVHLAGLGVFMGAAIDDNHRFANGIYIFLLFFVLYWAIAVKLITNWWKARRAKQEPPE